jgi:hypothetical protein
MRLRLLVFLPLAGLITFLLLSGAASFVSALESSMVPGEAGPGPMLVTKYETYCDGLVRQLHALSHEVGRCGETRSCDGSPLLCPVALDDEIDRTYRRLRSSLHAQCGFPLRLIDFAWDGPHASDGGGRFGREAGFLKTPARDGNDPFVDATCGGRHDWLEAATSGEAAPTRYSF